MYQNKNETQTVEPVNKFDLEIGNEQREISVKIHCKDGGDAVFIAGFVVNALTQLGVEAKCKVMP